MLTLEAARARMGSFTLRADLVVTEGMRVAVIGPSGAGKSTLLAMIAGFQPLESGRILWKGENLVKIPPGLRPVSILFQDANLFPHLTLAQNVGLGLRPDLRLTRPDWARVEASLARVGLAGMGGRKPAALSGGQQSRAALARVLIRARPVLLLDEPFAALGPALTAEMLGLVAEISAETGATLMMVTHQMADARALTPQAILVSDGLAHAPQSTGALLAHPPPALQRYLG